MVARNISPIRGALCGTFRVLLLDTRACLLFFLQRDERVCRSGGPSGRWRGDRGHGPSPTYPLVVVCHSAPWFLWGQKGGTAALVAT